MAAIVLAAGRATRMGGAKLELPVGGRPMVQRVVDAALGSRASQVIVVVGREVGSLRDVLAGRPVTVVENPDHAAGMSTSVRAGLSAVDPAAAGALVLLGDQPFVSSRLIDALIDRFAESGALIVRPSVGGCPGNPVLFDAGLFAEVAAQRGDVGGRRIVERHAAEVALVPVDDPHELVDIDMPHEYEEERDA